MNNVPVQTTPAQRFQFDVFLAQVKGFLDLTDVKRAKYTMVESQISGGNAKIAGKLDALRLALEATPSVSTNEFKADLEKTKFYCEQQGRKLEDEMARVNAEADRALADAEAQTKRWQATC